MPSSGRFGVFLRGISPPAGGEFLCPRRQRNQNAAGDGSDEHFVLIVAFPRTPLRGTLSCLMLLNFRRAKMEWPPRFLPGHWALGLQKLPLVRFRWCAWVSRTNAHGPVSAVGATLAVARKPSPWGEGGTTGGRDG